MELERLKTIWQETIDAEVEDHLIDRDKVQALIKKRSNTAVAQIKRKVRNKVFMAGGIGLLLIMTSVVAFNSEEPLFSLMEALFDAGSNIIVAIFYLVFGLVLVFISIFNAVSYRKISALEYHDCDLKTSIKSILTIIRKAIRVKIYSDALVIPATVFTMIIVDLILGSLLFTSTHVLLISIAGALGFAALSWFMTKWGQKKRYGSQIKALEECLLELQEDREKKNYFGEV